MSSNTGAMASNLWYQSSYITWPHQTTTTLQHASKIWPLVTWDSCCVKVTRVRSDGSGTGRETMMRFPYAIEQVKPCPFWSFMFKALEMTNESQFDTILAFVSSWSNDTMVCKNLISQVNRGMYHSHDVSNGACHVSGRKSKWPSAAQDFLPIVHAPRRMD